MFKQERMPTSFLRWKNTLRKQPFEVKHGS